MRPIFHLALWSVGLAAPETQTTEAERACLFRHASNKKRLVEIGVWHGVSSCGLRRAMHPEGLLTCVDPFPSGRLAFSVERVVASREVSKIRRGLVRWLRTTGEEAGRSYAAGNEPPVDYLFIDGDHSYAGLKSDWIAWKRLVAEGGIVALHDSCSSGERCIDDAGSVKFTDEVILRDANYEVIEVVDTLTVLRRRERTVSDNLRDECA
jgi:predicted O-methyltransferase YrrM